ncbi:YfiT family bacillithiol transferase [Algoriphagus machipongonensis]|uniref:Metal-dependent hydrolase n=1 Tax=Algoriphagus machipongonensis TaxID=388413 RepID=A3HUJ3_9BACT|nr:putative metal-dependent hydrolase [Algoriphagus machipongonensis]EAZ81815.1 putative metal-dependent hydrolase [Algoriphagus machipongonensis]
MIDIELLKYPIGKFQKPEAITQENIKEAIAEFKALPKHLEATVKDLLEPQLQTPYRPGGWTVRQVVHHLADSHMNAYMRFKLALTESNPTIKPYDEAAWANLSDSKLPIEISIGILKNIHFRLGTILDEMSDSDFSKTYYHPESQSTVPLKEVILMYDWHGKHHLAHIQALMIREKW